MSEATEPETQPATETPAEVEKKKGNDAYLAKNYLVAIEHYGAAIDLEPESAVYYSNRSACYASLKQWEKAYEDAVLCISKDNKFIKGYYRLSSAQTELKMFDDSIATLRAALTLEPGNEVLLRQMKAVTLKKAAAAQPLVKPLKQLDETQRKEVMELQEQTQNYARDSRAVRAKLGQVKRDAQVNQVTQKQLQSLDTDTKMYRAVGKSFVFADRSEVEGRLDKEVDVINKDFKDLTDRDEFLQRRILANQNNIKDITTGYA
jgi:chaperonin cofactor prefoldin